MSNMKAHELYSKLLDLYEEVVIKIDNDKSFICQPKEVKVLGAIFEILEYIAPQMIEERKNIHRACCDALYELQNLEIEDDLTEEQRQEAEDFKKTMTDLLSSFKNLRW